MDTSQVNECLVILMMYHFVCFVLVGSLALLYYI